MDPNALTRKIGNFPVWMWAGVAFLALYIIRSRMSTTQSSSSPTIVPQGSAIYDPRIDTLFSADSGAQPAPQAPTVLQPGESVYDPNSGNLVNTPGSLLTVGSTGGTNPTASAAQLAQAIPAAGNVTAAATPTAA